MRGCLQESQGPDFGYVQQMNVLIMFVMLCQSFDSLPIGIWHWLRLSWWICPISDCVSDVNHWLIDWFDDTSFSDICTRHMSPDQSSALITNQLMDLAHPWLCEWCESLIDVFDLMMHHFLTFAQGTCLPIRVRRWSRISWWIWPIRDCVSDWVIWCIWSIDWWSISLSTLLSKLILLKLIL